MKDEIKEILDYYQKDIDRYEKNMKNYTEYQQKTTFSKSYQRYKNHKLLLDYITNLQEENERLNNIIDETTKYVKSLSSSGRSCDIYDDIKKEILNELKGDNK